MSNIISWLRAHVWATAGLALLLGIGLGSSETGDAGSEPASTKQAASTQDSAALDEAEDEASELSAKNSELRAQLEEALSELREVKDQLSFEESKRPLQDLSGRTKGDLKKLANRFGWTLVYRTRASSATPGTVISQSISPGATVHDGSKIVVVLAKAPKPPKETETASAPSECTPGYQPCLPPASDYDCAGGSGDGPAYTGYVTVTGSDPYGLDSDGDGAGCE